MLFLRNVTNDTQSNGCAQAKYVIASWAIEFYQCRDCLGVEISDCQNSSSFQFFKLLDSWIDNLVQFNETIFSTEVSSMFIGQALYKLEASKDIGYVVFIETFHVNVNVLFMMSHICRMT